MNMMSMSWLSWKYSMSRWLIKRTMTANAITGNAYISGTMTDMNDRNSNITSSNLECYFVFLIMASSIKVCPRNRDGTNESTMTGSGIRKWKHSCFGANLAISGCRSLLQSQSLNNLFPSCIYAQRTTFKALKCTFRKQNLKKVPVTHGTVEGKNLPLKFPLAGNL